MNGKIKILDPEEAKKIAAGEVVDRPASLIREFIDNSLDAGSTQIEVSIEEGGIKSIEVLDNGSGMNRDDLEICCKTYATSKIRAMEELLKTRTLGFRGEALAAAAAVSNLEIVSSTDGQQAYQLHTAPFQNEVRVESTYRQRGTSVRAQNIFATMPARKVFLKKPWSEAAYCRQIFIDKALAFPQVCFKFIEDGNLKIFLKPVQNYKQRFSDAVQGITKSEKQFIDQISAQGNGYSVTIVAGGPEVYRTHKRTQFVFANGRRISDFGFQQALEYGSQGSFPNGTHPIGALFIEVDPSMADFNIHPAKREARFTCAAEIHHTITETLRNHFRHIHIRNSLYGGGAASGSKLYTEREFQMRGEEGEVRNEDVGMTEEGGGGAENFDAVLSDSTARPAAGILREEYENGEVLRYVGMVFDFFILVEKGDKLYAIDRHAAHERMVYDEMLNSEIEKQDMLVPIKFHTESNDDDVFLSKKKEDLRALGICLRREGDAWMVDALPVLWNLGANETVREILNLRQAGDDIAQTWAARVACHSSIRDGEAIDDVSAFKLAKDALKMGIKSCPHGRPILFEMRRDYFLKAVRRM